MQARSVSLLTTGSSDRGRRLRRTKEEVDDWVKSVAFAGAFRCRSSLSLGAVTDGSATRSVEVSVRAQAGQGYLVVLFNLVLGYGYRAFRHFARHLAQFPRDKRGRWRRIAIERSR
jgi:hypothetical protein